MHTPWSHAFKYLTATTFTLALTACGGGGSSSDTTPEAFSFTALTDVAFASSNESESVTIIDISTAVDVSISGGEYSIDGGAFTSTAGTITEGQTLTVAVTADSEFSTTSTATITVGDVSASFSVTTLAQDISPALFSFTDISGVEFNTLTTSDAITVTDINDAAPISISGGEYQINDGEFVTAAGTVEEDDTVTVRLTSGDTIDVVSDAILTIGDVSDTFSVTTIGDTTPPTAEIIFPTPTTLTDGTQVTLRGKASDDFSAVTKITVTVTTDDGATVVDTQELEATETDNFIDTWSQVVTLAESTVNTISVTATDAAGNVQVEPVVITMTQESEFVSFPIGTTYVPPVMGFETQIAFDKKHNRLLHPNVDSSVDSFSLIATDILTGERSDFLSTNFDDRKQNFSVIIDNSGDFAYVSAEDEIYEVNLDTEESQIFIDNTNADESNSLDYITAMGLDSNDNLYINDPGSFTLLKQNIFSEERIVINQGDFDQRVSGIVVDEDNERLIAFRSSQATSIDAEIVGIDLVNYDTTVLVDDGLFNQDGDDYLFALHFAIDNNNRALYTHVDFDQIYSMDLTTSEISVFSGIDLPMNNANQMLNPNSIVINEDDNVAFVVDDDSDNTRYSSVFVIDVNTGERVVLSRWVR